jgi:hypothetical protein
MNQKLIEILKLKPLPGKTEVSDEQILQAVIALQMKDAAAQAAADHDTDVRRVMANSCGALSHASAEEVLAARKARKTRKA